MKLPRRVYDDIREHVLETVPREACGLVGVAPATGIPVRAFRCSNVHSLPRVAYRIDKDDLEFSMWAMEQNGWRLGAVYHSHPDGRATPSLPDIEAACPNGKVAYPGVVHLIMGRADIVRTGMTLHDPESRMAMQGFRIEQDGARCRVSYEPLELV